VSRLCLVIVAGALTAGVSLVAGAVPATVQQPRAFGHTIGDVLTQRLLLGDDELAAVPPSGRIGAWFERRMPRLETDAAGRRWLAIEYQVVNAPRTLTNANLPALTLKARSGHDWQIAEWPITVGPLTPDNVAAQGDLQAVRPDHEVGVLPTAPIRQRLNRLAAGLTLTLVAWFAWWLWRNQREAIRLPFARAWADLQGFDSAAVQAEPAAWLSVHRALDATAGRVVTASTLNGLLVSAPHLRALAPQLEAFYQRSSERFFATEPIHAPYPLGGLCLALRDAEKRHHGGA
jgi:mxaA protein